MNFLQFPFRCLKDPSDIVVFEVKTDVEGKDESPAREDPHWKQNLTVSFGSYFWPHAEQNLSAIFPVSKVR